MVTDTVTELKDKSQKLEDLAIASPKAEETPPSSKQPSPKERTYSEKELSERVQEAVHKALMNAGRDWKTAEKERDDFAVLLKETKAANDKMTLQIDELVAENPDKFNVVKKGRELDEQEQRVKQERQSLEAEKQSHQQEIKLAQETLRGIAIWDVAEEFEGSDPVKLKALADTLNTKTEDIGKIAETLWKKKESPTAPAAPELKVDSGFTIGGLSEQTIRDNYRNHPNDPKAKADYLAWRRKKGI